MNSLFKMPVPGLPRRLSLQLLTSSMVLIGITAVAAEIKEKTVADAAELLPAVLLPTQLLTTEQSGTVPAQVNSYQPLLNQSIAMPELSNWQDANTRVRDIGGWMFYASEGDAGPDHTKQHSEQHSQHQQHSEKNTPATTVKDQP